MGHSTTNVFNVGPMVIDKPISYNPISRLDFQNLTDIPSMIVICWLSSCHYRVRQWT